MNIPKFPLYNTQQPDGQCRYEIHLKSETEPIDVFFITENPEEMSLGQQYNNASEGWCLHLRQVPIVCNQSLLVFDSLWCSDFDLIVFCLHGQDSCRRCFTIVSYKINLWLVIVFWHTPHHVFYF